MGFPYRAVISDRDRYSQCSASMGLSREALQAG